MLLISVWFRLVIPDGLRLDLPHNRPWKILICITVSTMVLRPIMRKMEFIQPLHLKTVRFKTEFLYIVYY